MSGPPRRCLPVPFAMCASALRWRDAGRLPDASVRVLERELDHEERIVPGPDGH